MLTKPVGEIVRTKRIQSVLAVASDATIAAAVSLMAANHVGAVLVRSASGVVEGIFTERDLMRRVVAEGRDPRTTLIGSVMSRQVRRVATTATVDEALRLMIEFGHRHLLVEDGTNPVTLISVRDLMSWLVLPDEPIAAEGRGGVIRARAEDAIRTIQNPD